MPLVVLGLLRARRGDPDPWAPLDEALELARQIDELQRLAPVAAARAEAHWLAGRPEEIDAETGPALAAGAAAWTTAGPGRCSSIWRQRAGLAGRRDGRGAARPPLRPGAGAGRHRRGGGDAAEPRDPARPRRPGGGQPGRPRAAGTRRPRRAAGAAPGDQREPRRPDRARDRGAGAARRGRPQRRDRGPAVPLGAHGPPPRLGDPQEAVGELAWAGGGRGGPPGHRRKIGRYSDVREGGPF